MSLDKPSTPEARVSDMNTPTPAQALGAVLKLGEQAMDEPDYAKRFALYCRYEEAAADLLDQHGQHFAGLEEENENLRTVMIAAAEEIQEHWEAHCDAEGYGPANLMRRLEQGFPAEYGYKAGDFDRLQKRAEAAEARCDEAEDDDGSFSVRNLYKATPAQAGDSNEN